jgi:hypothetical protein
MQGFLSYLHILPNRKKPLPILHDVCGIIKPRRLISRHKLINGYGMEHFVLQRTSTYISCNNYYHLALCFSRYRLMGITQWWTYMNAYILSEVVAICLLNFYFYFLASGIV